MIHIPILFFSLAGSALILFFAFKNRQSPGASSLIVLGAVLPLAASANFSIYHAPVLNIFFYYALLFLATRICYISILTFTIQFTHNENWLTPRLYLILAIEPIISQIWFWSDAGRNLPSLGLNISPSNVFFENPGLLLTSFYTNLLLVLAILLIARDFNTQSMAYRYQATFVLTGISSGLLIGSNFGSSNFLPVQDVRLISILMVVFSFIGAFFHSKFLKVTPIARASVVQYMSDGWIVLDRGNNIVDMNPMAEKIIGKTARELAGQPAEKIFNNWPNLKYSLNEAKALDVKGSIQIGEAWTYLNIYISPLTDGKSEPFGKLIVWRDITDRRLVDEARQQARDEMFILLHSITSAASRALNLDDFLQEIIYQIVYSTHSQSIAVYLIEEHQAEENKPTFILAAQHGLPMDSNGKMFSILEASEVVTQVIEHGRTVLIPDIQIDEHIPGGLQIFSPLSLLAIPMLVEGQVLGIISFTREGTSSFSSAEVERLAIITDEVASFIDSNRQRQLSIALAERQRLVRDLHDSVTQQLYGLVMLAEATRAGIKAGIADMPAKVIDSMAESARQALKEMRLFLYQMQPVDFAKIGLYLALQQRLNAVEGRADIDTKLIMDKEAKLPLELQLALYFIAQEALNNILKHARAKHVKVTLNIIRSNYIFEIEDDGIGFDPQTVSSGGIGIRSMHDRAAQFGGQLIISATPGTGTKITVSIDSPQNSWRGK